MDLENLENLKKSLADLNLEYKMDVPLAPYTTFKIGGPADILIEAHSKEELIQIIQLAQKYDVPFTMLGWGSNVLISDKGIRGIVIQNKANQIKILGQNLVSQDQDNKPKAENTDQDKGNDIRLDQLEPEKYYSFEDLDYNETNVQKVKVEIESGAGLPMTIARLIREGVTGLQWFGGIPGTIGGAVYNNIHGGSHFLAEYIETVETFDPVKEIINKYTSEECQFGYDASRFHKTKEIILSATFNLNKGDTDKAKYVFREWIRRKAMQPQKSAGCVWQNISEQEKQALGLESSSWGFIIDKILGLKGKTIGGAKISEKHAAFIENFNSAKAQDVIELMDLIIKTSQKKLGITPRSEIFLIGEK